MVVLTLTGGIGGDLRKLLYNYGRDNDVITVTYDPVAYPYQILTVSGADRINLQNANTGNTHSVYSGSGRDSIFGGAGVEYIFDQSGNDLFALRGGTDFYYSGKGNDTVNGGAGADTINFIYVFDDKNNGIVNTRGVTCDLAKTGVQNFGVFGNDRISGFDNSFGSNGADQMYGTSEANKLYGNSGNDLLIGRAGIDELLGNAGKDKLLGGTGADFLDGGDGHDRLLGDRGADTLLGQIGNDVIFGGSGADDLSGAQGNDTLTGGAGIDYLEGFEGNDRLKGGNAGDSLFGGVGNDFLMGGAGADYLNADQDSDRLAGGRGADTIVLLELTAARDIIIFNRLSDSSTGTIAGTIDEIRYFDQGGLSTDDKIDLRAIDANPNKAGNQAFLFRGTGNFTAPSGEVRLVESGGNTLIQVDIDRDGRSEMNFLVQGVIGLTAGDFFL